MPFFVFIMVVQSCVLSYKYFITPNNTHLDHFILPFQCGEPLRLVLVFLNSESNLKFIIFNAQNAFLLTFYFLLTILH